jgi:hypothetical protein
MEVLNVLSGYAASACLGVAFTITVIEIVVRQVNQEHKRVESCFGIFLIGNMLLLSLLFMMIADFAGA